MRSSRQFLTLLRQRRWLVVGAHSDRTRERCLHIAGAALVGAAGLGATAVVQTPVPGLIALSVAAMGVFSAIPVFWSLPTTFLSGTAAAGAIALINSLGNLARVLWTVPHRARTRPDGRVRGQPDHYRRPPRRQRGAGSQPAAIASE